MLSRGRSDIVEIVEAFEIVEPILEVDRFRA